MSAYSDHILALVPKAYWRMGEASGYIQDSSGNAHHADAKNDPTYGAAGALSGDTDKAMTFDGAADYMGVPDHANLETDYNEDFTLMFWAKWTAATAARYPLQKWYSSETRYPWAVRDDGAGHFAIKRSDGTRSPEVASTGPAKNDGAWHYFVARKSGAELRWLVDDALSTAGTDTTTSTTTGSGKVYMGITPGATSFWAGSLDEVAFWKSALAWGDCLKAYYIGKYGTLWVPKQPQVIAPMANYHKPRWMQ